MTISFPWTRRKHHDEKKRDEQTRDALSSEMIADLQSRRDAAEGFLVPRQRRNHWQESIVAMIQSGGQS